MSCKLRLGGPKRPERIAYVAVASTSVAPPPSAADSTLPLVDHEKAAWKRLYNGTWSHTEMPDLFSPSDMSKKDFGELLVSLCDEMFNAMDGAKRRKQNRMLRISVFEEKHAALTMHYHFPMLAEWHWSGNALAALLRKHGIYVSFSSDHTYYWTAVVYLAVPSDMPDGKREADLDPKPWLCAGHPTIRDVLEEIPRGARLSDKSRVRRYLDIAHPNTGQNVFALSDKHFNMKIIKKGLKDLTAVLGWVQLRSEETQNMTAEERMEFVGIEAYCLRNQIDLARRISFAWELHGAPRKIALQEQSAWDAVLAAREWKCTCSGRWIPLTEQLLAMHVKFVPPHLAVEAPHSIKVRQALRRCLQQGCKKFTNVFIYGPKTSGKSHVAKAVAKIFQDRAFLRPVGPNNFPLQKIFGKKVCVLQDIRVETFKLGFDALLVWWEGETFPVPLPQNRHDGDRTYTETAPVIATSGDKLRISANEALRLQVDPEKQNAMMDDRFLYLHFPRTFRKDEVVEVDPCARCCADWISNDMPTLTTANAPASPQTAPGSSSDAGPSSGPSACGPIPSWPLLGAPPMSGDPHTHAAPAVVGDQPQDAASAFVALLERLQRLHTSGALSDVEFVAAKRKLLQLR